MVKCEDCTYRIRDSLVIADKRCYWGEDMNDRERFCLLYYPSMLVETVKEIDILID